MGKHDCLPSVLQSSETEQGSPIFTRAFNGESDVLLWDPAFLQAFDSGAKGNAEIISIWIF